MHALRGILRDCVTAIKEDRFVASILATSSSLAIVAMTLSYLR
jgi:hypothetical protein